MCCARIFTAGSSQISARAPVRSRAAARCRSTYACSRLKPPTDSSAKPVPGAAARIASAIRIPSAASMPAQTTSRRPDVVGDRAVGDDPGAAVTPTWCHRSSIQRSGRAVTNTTCTPRSSTPRSTAAVRADTVPSEREQRAVEVGGDQPRKAHRDEASDRTTVELGGGTLVVHGGGDGVGGLRTPRPPGPWPRHGRPSRSISMSLRPSPIASTSARSTPSSAATCARPEALLTPTGAGRATPSSRRRSRCRAARAGRPGRRSRRRWRPGRG